MKTKRILAVHDLSCHGAASLGIALPVLTAFGHGVVVLPSVVLSSTTDLDEDPVALATTAWMRKVLARWEEQHLMFDAMYTGWLGDPKQVALLVGLCDQLHRQNACIFVDPVLGDGGSLYPSQEGVARAMRDLVLRAHVMTPNPTEAAILLRKQPREYGVQEDGTVTVDWASALAHDLTVAYPRVLPILKSVVSGDRIGVCVRYTPENTSVIRRPATEMILGRRTTTASVGGTGDLFASVLVARWMRELPRRKCDCIRLIQSVVDTMSRVMRIMQRDKASHLPFRTLLQIKGQL